MICGNLLLTLQTKKQGAMLEWLKRHAWKACKRQKRFPSSNLGRSAKKWTESFFKDAEMRTRRVRHRRQALAQQVIAFRRLHSKTLGRSAKI